MSVATSTVRFSSHHPTSHPAHPLGSSRANKEMPLTQEIPASQSPAKFETVFKEQPEISDTASIAASSNASNDCTCTCHTHLAGFGVLTEEWIANHDDSDDVITSPQDMLDSVLDELVYRVDASSTSSSSSGSSSASFSGQIEANLQELPAALDALDAVKEMEEGIDYLAGQLHDAQLLKGLASVQLKKAIKIFRNRIRVLKVHELLYNQALTNARRGKEHTDDGDAWLYKIDKSARSRALHSIGSLGCYFCHGAEFALLPTFGITPQSLVSRVAQVQQRAKAKA
ncbi:hypothetical protein BKA70DRAFT_1431515 [Coprinopsis sp. MPI-PUGE-AT-0042]|nr:hypothetical protein BKA70DRAFT_1431515 [Coprinopsis sp. MPI-PUGE-AT-0042]